MRYVGQPGRYFRIRFAEYFRDCKYNTNKSKFAQHLLDNKHSIGPIEDIMKGLYRTNKGKLMDTMESYYIYKDTQLNNQINDRNIAKPNIIFDTLFMKTLAERAQQTNTSPSTRPVSRSLR
jgi:hypothetical protein